MAVSRKFSVLIQSFNSIVISHETFPIEKVVAIPNVVFNSLNLYYLGYKNNYNNVKWY